MVKNHIQRVFYQIKGRKTGCNIIKSLCEELNLERASAEKRVKIFTILQEMKENSDSFNKNSKLHTELLVHIADWESARYYEGLEGVP